MIEVSLWDFMNGWPCIYGERGTQMDVDNQREMYEQLFAQMVGLDDSPSLRTQRKRIGPVLARRKND